MLASYVSHWAPDSASQGAFPVRHLVVEYSLVCQEESHFDSVLGVIGDLGNIDIFVRSCAFCKQLSKYSSVPVQPWLAGGCFSK